MPPEKLRVLLSTTLFPNRAEKTRCVFVEKLARALEPRCELDISVPLPWTPPLLKRGPYAHYRAIPAHDQLDGLRLRHPRYFVIPKLARSLHGLFMFLSLLRHHRRLIASHRPDVILGVWAYPDGFANLLTGRLFSIPVVISCRGSDINYLARKRLHRALIRWTLCRAALVLSVSEALKREIVALGVPADKVIVIPNGIEAEKFQPLPPAEARHRLNLEPDRRYVVSVSRLSHEKGLDILLNALALMRDQTVHLLLVGGGAERSALKALAQRLGIAARVTFVGDTTHTQIPLWLNAADLFVLPSRTEGWPNVLMEALACGKPVVGTNVGGIPEIIDSTTLGHIVPAEDPQALADAMDTALTSRWDPVAIRASVENRDWGTVAGETCLALGSIVQHPGTPGLARLSHPLDPAE